MQLQPDRVLPCKRIKNLRRRAGRRNALRITILGGGDYATQSLVLVVSAIMAMRIPYRG